jgi:hypothetical protein
MNQDLELTPAEVAKWCAYIDQLTEEYRVTNATK